MTRDQTTPSSAVSYVWFRIIVLKIVTLLSKVWVLQTAAYIMYCLVAFCFPFFGCVRRLLSRILPPNWVQDLPRIDCVIQPLLHDSEQAGKRLRIKIHESICVKAMQLRSPVYGCFYSVHHKRNSTQKIRKHLPRLLLLGRWGWVQSNQAANSGRAVYCGQMRLGLVESGRAVYCGQMRLGLVESGRHPKQSPREKPTTCDTLASICSQLVSV